MQHILLPTDFSKAAQNAVDYAFSLFNGSTCAFHFLNTYTPDFIHSRVMALASTGSPEEDAMQVASEEGLRNLIDSLADQYPDSGFEYNTVSSFNLLTEEIREQVELHNIDLIVSGTTGASGLKEVFLGSNTVRILRTASETPVLVIPQLLLLLPFSSRPSSSPNAWCWARAGSCRLRRAIGRACRRS